MPWDSETDKPGPAFQLYPKDFLASTAHMTLEEVGAYFRLLCYAWENGSIPRERSRQAAMISTTPDHMEELWGEVGKKFKPMEGRGLINVRLEKTRIEQLAFREERSRSGSKGAASRWRKAEPPTKPMAEPIAEPSISQWQNHGPSSASSSSPSSSSAVASPSATASEKDLPDSGESEGLVKSDRVLFSGFIEAWNRVAVFGRMNGEAAHEKQRRLWKTRSRHRFFRENWERGLDAAVEIPFLRGENERGWSMDAEFFLRASTLETILEGGKKWGGKGAALRRAGPKRASEVCREMIDDLRRAEAAKESSEALVDIDVEVIR